MRELVLGERKRIAPLFAGWEESMILSCLQGVMGRAWEAGKGARIQVGDFCLLAGEPAEELVRYVPEEYGKNFMLMLPGTEDWSRLIEKIWGENCRRIERYALKKEPDGFDWERLEEYAAALPAGYQMMQIEEELFWRVRQEKWSEDLSALFPDWEFYRKYGLGFVIFHGKELVCGASSYNAWKGGIEIEIDTRADFRRKGLACCCGARLILECKKRGLYPSWDAASPESLRLAEKLGYRLAGAYPAYEVAL